MVGHTLLLVGGTLQQGGAERIISVLSKEFLKYFVFLPYLSLRISPVLAAKPYFRGNTQRYKKTN